MENLDLKLLIAQQVVILKRQEKLERELKVVCVYALPRLMRTNLNVRQ